MSGNVQPMEWPPSENRLQLSDCQVLFAAPLEQSLCDIRSSASSAERLSISAATLLGERARLLGLSPPGLVSAGGACHLIDCANGAVALNLPRSQDWDMVDALLGDSAGIARDDWVSLSRRVGRCDADAVVEQARLLGLACARADLAPVPPRSAAVVERLAPAVVPQQDRPPVVLDLSSLWAGPLCGHLLERGGARVIKVEAPSRPDGARQSEATFYNLLNQGKACLALDLQSEADRSRLVDLIDQADIVIESTRPRVLRNFGLCPHRLSASRPGLTWISITAYGREPEHEDWVGFGDDAAAAAGLCTAVQAATGRLAFAGDALADPLTGIEAARQAWSHWRAGGGVMVSLALVRAAGVWLGDVRKLAGPQFLPMMAQFQRLGFNPTIHRSPDRVTYAVGEHNGWTNEALTRVDL